MSPADKKSSFDAYMTKTGQKDKLQKLKEIMVTEKEQQKPTAKPKDKLIVNTGNTRKQENNT